MVQFRYISECGSKDLYRPAEEQNFFNSVPYFDLSVPHNNRNLSGEAGLESSRLTSCTGVEGKTARLVCTVRSRADRTVSWIRRGVHPVVLSSGAVTFTSDTR